MNSADQLRVGKGVLGRWVEGGLDWSMVVGGQGCDMQVG